MSKVHHEKNFVTCNQV